MAADEDGGSSGSSTRASPRLLHCRSRRQNRRTCSPRTPPDLNQGTVPSSVPPRGLLFSSPILGRQSYCSVPPRGLLFSSPILGRQSYSLRHTPDREQRSLVANNQQVQSVMLLQQLATVSSQRDQAPTDPIGHQQVQEQPVAHRQQTSHQ
jgi:hypothetical protein